MKLNTHALRYLTADDWRVLTAVEMGSKNHEVVPTPLITKISGLRAASGVNKAISMLAKSGLIAKVKNAKYDGYRLTYGGLDYLALHTLVKRKSAYSVGNQIGIGKESDIYVVADDSGTQRVLKIHRLGRISFRAVKNQRDYLRNRNSASWMYMSRLAATKEFAFMKLLYDNDFPVPRPISQSRHCIIMELIDSFPLRQVTDIADPPKLYSDLMDLILKFAAAGLIHGDFNEFNILVDEETQTPHVIDFPQMISIEHPNAKEQFYRDVNCIKTFFQKKFRYTSDVDGPHWEDVKRTGALDAEVLASGFTKKMMKDLEKYMTEVAPLGTNDEDWDGSDDDDEDEDEQEDEEGDEDEEQEDVEHTERKGNTAGETGLEKKVEELKAS
ncbi:RIO1-domain-containing protein [Ascodesmis nigricans]|uniref:Serine/threonine-protein kinase RIO2 n=1 Tax=Ascodesmis nigricans TaxID=341454 RepID=A0A4S2N157_9PEZI|nr:RIO1-domain-containing protein [Ascodesmis nigricans]